MNRYPARSTQSILKIQEWMAAGSCDFHLHTHYSDGSDSPDQLVERVGAARLRVFAITDHDTLDAIAPARTALDRLAVEQHSAEMPVLVPGVELSVDDGRELHLLGYFPLGGESFLEGFLSRQRVLREKRNEQMLKRLAELGYPIRETDFLNSGEAVLGRLQVARLLVKEGFFRTVAEAFDQLLSDGRPGFLERPRPSINEAIDAIRQAGGAAVLAHPANYGWCTDEVEIKPELIERLLRYRAAGLQGVEAFHGEASLPQQLQIEAAARVAGLVVTGGSDDHGHNKPHAHLYRQGKAFDPRPLLPVTAALVEDMTPSGKRGLLLARRSGQRGNAGLWEFPGGKIEPGETPTACLERELSEELQVSAAIGPLTVALYHDYGDFRVALLCYPVKLSGEPKLDPAIHDAWCVATIEEARRMDLLAADYIVLHWLEKNHRQLDDWR